MNLFAVHGKFCLVRQYSYVHQNIIIEDKYKKISISDITALFLSSSFVITTDCMETNVTSAGREESDPSPMGYGRRGPAAGGAAWRQNGGGGAQAPGSQQRYVQPWPKRTSMV